MEQWIIQHVYAAISAAAIIAAGVTFATKYLPSLAEKEVAFLDSQLLAGIKEPTVKTFAVKVEQAICEAVPDAGDAKYAVLTDLIMRDLPLGAAPSRPLILAVLAALGSGAKAGLADAAK